MSDTKIDRLSFTAHFVKGAKELLAKSDFDIYDQIEAQRKIEVAEEEFKKLENS